MADLPSAEEAQRFKELADPWFDALREEYKETLAELFENEPTEETRVLVEQVGAQIAVLTDMRALIERPITNKQIEDQYDKEDEA